MFPRLASSVLVAVLTAVVAVAWSPPATAEVERERVIVQVRDGDPGIVARDLAVRHGGRIGHVYRHAVSGFVMELPSPAVAALRADPRIMTVEPDVPVRMFGEVPTGIARSALTENAVADIDGLDDRRVDVDIAVLDTGIDATHPDLNVAGGVDCTTGRCLPDPLPTDLNGHGTHVAGTAAAIDDGAGVVGAAPGARLWSVKVLEPDGSGLMSAVMAGLEWVHDNAGTVEVANTSFGCDPERAGCASDTLDAAVGAVADAGVVIVAAAGNSSDDMDGHALTAHPDVITVSAMADLDGEPGGSGPSDCGEEDDTFASFSNFGDAVDLAAPGVCILSTWPLERLAYLSGTSMAAPHVAGAAGLYIVQHRVTRSPDRPATVRNGLIADWSVPQSSACGFSGGITEEPLLYLTACADDAPADEDPTPSTSSGEDDSSTSDPDGADREESASIGRLAGSDRIATSVDISRQVFDDGAPAAVVAYGGDFPDALAATPLATALGGPVLLNVRDRLHADVAAELDRLGASTAYVMGGTAVQTSQVEQDIRARGIRPVRVSGADRFATGAEAAEAAVRVWEEAGVPVSSNAVLALGTDFPDALSGGALAAARRSPLLLTGRDHLPGATSDALRELGTDSVTIMGGTAAVSQAVADQLDDQGYSVSRVAGATRFATAVGAADAAVRAGAEYRSVLIASGRSFPDALAGAPAVASRNGVLLLSERDDLPDPSSEALRTAEHVNWVRLAGGTAVLTDAVRDEAAAATGISP